MSARYLGCWCEGDVEVIQFRVAHYVGFALEASDGVRTPLGRQLHRLSVVFSKANTTEQLIARRIRLRII